MVESSARLLGSGDILNGYFVRIGSIVHESVLDAGHNSGKLCARDRLCIDRIQITELSEY